MEGDASRTAFELSCVHQRRDSAAVSSVAVDADGCRLYVGLDNGMLEEYKLLFAKGSEVARVSARRSISKKSIKDMCQIGMSSCLAILIEDGSVLLCDMNSLEPKPLPGVKSAVAIASESTKASSCALAVAIPARLSTNKSSIDIFEVTNDELSGSGPASYLIQQHTVQEEVKDLKWMNGQILFCTRQSYKSINGSGVSDLLKPSCMPMLTAIPAAGVVALLWEDTMAVIADASGNAARPPLNLPSRPLVLSQGGMCVVAVCVGSGILIFDQMSSRLVQRIPFEFDGRPGQAPDEHEISSGDTLSGSCVVLASARRIWILRPVAPEMQAVQLLRAKSYEAALDLAEQCAGGDAPWVETCFAQAGLLLVQELCWRAGVEAIEKCSPSEFQPCELFPLFPEWTSSHTHQIPRKEYWGLHTELADVPTMVNRFHIRRQMSRDDIEPGTSWQFQGMDPEASTSGREEHIREARECVASHLLKVRGRKGVDCLEGVDTLIVHLLASIGDAGRLESFLSKPQNVNLEDVKPFLLECSRPHALALLLSELGECSAALDVWQKMTAHELCEGHSTSGAAMEADGDGARVAKYHAARLLLDVERVSDGLALHHLRWLRDASPYRFVQVIKTRHLPISMVLLLLKGQSLGLQWRYFEHLICSNLTQDAQHHTQHALVLIDSISDSGLDTEEKSSSADKTVGWGEEASTALLYTGSAKRDGGMIPRQYCLEPKSDLGHPPECYLHPDVLVSPSITSLRFALQSHLVRSKLYHANEVLKAVESICLYEEQVILYCRLRDHSKALRVLAVTLNDTGAAIRYCKKHAGHEGFLSLLEMLLQPGGDREPMYTEACQVLNAENGNLDPMQVLEALSEDMPLSIAYTTLSRMLRERIHRKRQTRVVHQLYRSREVLSRSERYKQQSTSVGRVVVEQDSQCAVCHKLLGGRIFYRYPNRSLVCASCHREHREKLSPSSNE